jgi:hypothetical protein
MNTDASNNEDVYIARKQGWPGCVGIMISHVPPTRDEQRVFSEWRHDGLTIERAESRDAAVAELDEYVAEQKRRAATTPPPPTQENLFT